MNNGIISKAIAWVFGANYRTSISGYITILAYFIHDKPQVIQWIPEPTKGILWNLSEWIFLGGFIAFAKQVKDRNVTGGTVQQSATGTVVPPELKPPLVEITKTSSPP